MSYFDKKHTGGSYASSGFLYQDLCSLIYLLKFATDPDFMSLTVETINDFTIIKTQKEISIQVKNKNIRLQDIDKLLEQHVSDKTKEYVFIGAGIDDKVTSLLLKKKQLVNSLFSDRKAVEKERHIEDFKRELEKIKLELFYEQIMASDFVAVPRNDAEMHLYYHLSTFLDKVNYSVDKKSFTNSLLVEVSKLRVERGSINNDLLTKLLKEYSIELTSENSSERSLIKFQEAPDILKVLGHTTSEIINPLSEQLQLAESAIENGNYKLALEIYTALSNLYCNEKIYFQCALLNEEIGDLIEAIKYCDKALELNNGFFEAYYVKGTCFGSQRKYDEAIINFKKALDLKEDSHIYYNLGYTYWLNQDMRSSVYYYEKSLEMDYSNADTHLNLSISYFNLNILDKSLEHVDQALSLEPNMFQGLARRGELFRYVGIYDEAELYFQQCLEIDENNYMALHGISLCLIEQGKVDQGMVYLGRLISVHDEFLFTGKDSVLLIDFGWYRTLPMKLEKVNTYQVIVDVLGMKLMIQTTLSKDLIFIGVISDATKQGLYPVVGKLFIDKSSYIETINQIQARVRLVQYSDKPIFFDTGMQIETHIVEMDNNVFIKLLFGDYVISGFTDTKGKEGYYGFQDYYGETGRFKIILGCSETHEEFIVQALSKLNIEKSDV